MKRAVILMNLGSPDSTSVRDLKKYLDEFLMDERVIDKPWLLRALLVKGIIVPFRAPKSAEAYKTVWTDKGSPLMVITRELQEALQARIQEPVLIAMRYGNPSPRDAYKELKHKHPEVEEALLLPLYPHYAMSSYETAVAYAREVHEKGKYSFRIKVLSPIYQDEAYIQALAVSIKPYLEQDYDKILFSYHGIPERHLVKSDCTGGHCLNTMNCCETPSPAHDFCYRHQCFTTTRMVVEALNIPADKYAISFQSRLGRDPWLQPYTAARLEAYPSEGVKKLLVVCPAFVSDCLETLEEIAEQGKESFLHAGGESFQLIPCLNSQPQWVSTLVGYLNGYARGDERLIVDKPERVSI